MSEVRDNFLMGTSNGPDGHKSTVLYELWVGCNLLRLNRPEDLIAFAEWVKTSAAYIDDIAQQAHGWTTPSSCPSQFDNLLEEQREIESFKRSKK